MTLRHKAIVISALMGLSIMVVGCSTAAPRVVTAPNTAGGRLDAPIGLGTRDKKTAGVINTTLMPAPSGVKTGVEGGKKD
jgi:hypothetical protein